MRHTNLWFAQVHYYYTYPCVPNCHWPGQVRQGRTWYPAVGVLPMPAMRGMRLLLCLLGQALHSRAMPVTRGDTLPVTVSVCACICFCVHAPTKPSYYLPNLPGVGRAVLSTGRSPAGDCVCVCVHAIAGRAQRVQGGLLRGRLHRAPLLCCFMRRWNGVGERTDRA